jgi:DNA-binding XRE family transcriptional regulator
MNDHTDSPHQEALAVAGALQIAVDDIFLRNDELEALNDSLTSAFDAVSKENLKLRATVEQRTRQRDAATRESGLLKAQMRKMHMISSETMKAIEPQQQALPDIEPANLKMFQRQAG